MATSRALRNTYVWCVAHLSEQVVVRPLLCGWKMCQAVLFLRASQHELDLSHTGQGEGTSAGFITGRRKPLDFFRDGFD